MRIQCHAVYAIRDSSDTNGKHVALSSALTIIFSDHLYYKLDLTISHLYVTKQT